MDNCVREGTDFTLAKILIDTCQFPSIHGWIYFSIRDEEFDIFVMEV